MLNHGLQGIDFARHQRWLDRAAGREVLFAVFDQAGTALWGSKNTGADAIGLSLAEKNNEVAGAQRLQESGVDKAALYQSLNLPGQGLLGTVVILAERFDPAHAPMEIDQLAEALNDIADSIVDECRYQNDMDGMAEVLGENYEELHLVYAVDQHVKNHVGENKDIFQSLLQSTAEHLNVDVVAYVQPGEDVCIYATALSKEIHNLDLVLVEMRGDLFRFIQASRETMVLNAADDPRRAYIFTDMSYKVLASPVVTSDNKVDSLIVLLNHAHKPDFSNSDRKLADVLANQVASLSKTYALINSMKEFNDQLASTLIEAVEAKDPYTRGHSERVHYLSMEIGRAMALDDLEDLHWGALLHDVGKIGIPDAVLCKPSRLTQDEYTFIMVHPERSYEILRHVKHLQHAVLGARHHQEMYDGSGYPMGLKGERIPLHARIIAVADTYDSITSSRAYRAGRSHEVAMHEIERVSGKQLDPVIIEIFKKIVAVEPEWLQRFNIKREKV